MRGVSIFKESSGPIIVQAGQELLIDCDFSFDKDEVGCLSFLLKSQKHGFSCLMASPCLVLIILCLNALGPVLC